MRALALLAHRGLGGIGRHATLLLAGGVFSGLLLQDLAAALRPLLMPSIGLLLFLSVLRLDWQRVFAYARRWQIEMAWRYTKSELALQSPRLWFWHNRMKLLMIVALVYAFLLSLMRLDVAALRGELLRRWCHRTGRRYREAALPLYRVRLALSRLWLTHPPSVDFPLQNSG